MAPNRGRGGLRGRGSDRGRRGRGRGRGGFPNRSSAGRTDEAVQDVPIEGPEAFGSGSESASDISSVSSSDDEITTPSNAYHSLLQTFVANQSIRPSNEGSRRKRRKLYETDSPSRRLLDEESSEEHNEDLSDEAERADVDDQDQVAALQEEAHMFDEEDDDSDGGRADTKGPFETHVESPEAVKLQIRIKAIASNSWTTKKSNVGLEGRCMVQIPGPDGGESPTRYKSTDSIKLKHRLVDNAKTILGTFSNVECVMASSLYEYQDTLFAARTVHNAERLRNMTCLHALNHIVKTRDRVLKNNAKLAAAMDGNDMELRDQGFTRPKILFMLETKQACVRMVESITHLYTFEQQENKKRFLDSFSLPQDKFGDDKPDDFKELFEGNDENEFRVGVKLTRKTLKFYSTFYNSDIIFASALGLRRAIEASDKKKHDHDFLSSIEMVILDQADAALMQNWEHVEFVFEHLNLQPKDPHGCDFSRVRSWYLDGHAPFLRQTIVLSAYCTPKINTLYNKHMRNVAGRLKYTPDYSLGLIENLSYGIKQTFSRFDSPTHLTDPDSRFKYFTSTILPQIVRLPKAPQGGNGVLVFIPSYLDFVRVRNSLVDIDISYASISEYTDVTDVRKARSHFMSGRHAMLLYTGRAHHFHRHNIRGVKRVVFYGVPENPRFYDEIAGFVAKTMGRGEVSRAEASVRVCFSRWERMELERIVGTKRLGKMIGDRGDLFDFV